MNVYYQVWNWAVVTAVRHPLDLVVTGAGAALMDWLTKPRAK